MKTAIMFSGVDALDLLDHRKAVVRIPEVMARFRMAEDILAGYGKSDLKLVEFLTGPDSIFLGNLPGRAFVSAVAQVGLFDRYLKTNPSPDYLVGCSLGDTARTACSGALSFEEMVYGTYIFNSVAQTIRGGAIVRVRSKTPVTDFQLREIESYGLTIAVHQTPQHFLVSGLETDLDRWANGFAVLRGFQIRPLYDKPLHSLHMSPALAAVKAVFARSVPKPPSIPMISCANQSVIAGADELVADIEQNMVGAVYWRQTFKWMVEGLGVRNFINIGPAQTLINFADRIPTFAPFNCEDLLSPTVRDIPYSPPFALTAHAVAG